MKHRILLSTSRSLQQPGAWGQAVFRLRSEGHKIVATSGSELPDAWTDGPQPRVLPSNIRSLMPEGVIPSKEAIRDYSAYRGSAGYADTHGMLLLMMSRVDSTGTFRSLERELLARKLHLEIFTALAEAQPTLGIFDVTPHEALDFALLRVLEWRDIPVLMFQPSLVGPQVIARTSLTDLLPIALDSKVVSRYADVLAEVHRIADASIQRLVEGTGTPKMDNQKAKEASVGTLRSRLSALRFSLRRLRTPGRDVAFALTGHIGIPVTLRRAAELFLERSLRSSLRKTIQKLPSLDQAPTHRFALFALHYEPERSSIPEGYPFDSQLDAIVAVRNMLPDNVTLYVKEHFSQQAAALRGFVGRSPEFYDLLESLPGVTVLGTKTNTRELMRSAECVMTFTGKVGIEAALEGSRVLYLGQPWWGQMPGAHNFHNLNSYQDLLSAPIPSPREVQSWLEDQIRSALLPGVSSVTPERHSKRIAQLPAGFEAVEVEGIIAAVHAVMAQAEKSSQDT
ncbi:hypothetical protein N9K72_04205 [Pontimonas sp.]|nr:hypothetical protein [Pontimonas sp.]